MVHFTIIVDGGHRAIIFSRLNGVLGSVYAEGLHFRIPWFNYPIIYDVRTRPYKTTSLTGSKGLIRHFVILHFILVTAAFVYFVDLQMVNISLRVLSRPEPTQLPRIYRKLGTDWDERVLPSICNEVCNFLFFNLSPRILLCVINSNLSLPWRQ